MTRIAWNKGLRSDGIERFWKYVHKTQNCWIWKGGITGQGYGAFWLDGRTIPAHRFSYEYLIGPIPEKMELDHKCRNRKCINPEHLEPVTSKENKLRGTSFSAVNAKKIFCVRGHRINDDVYIASSGYRHCRKCSRIREREYYKRDKQILQEAGQI